MKEVSPYLTSEEAAAQLRCPSVRAVYCFRWRRKKAGLLRLVDLDAPLSVMEAPVRGLRSVGRR